MEQFVKLCVTVSTDYSAYCFWNSKPPDIKERMARLDNLAAPKLERLYQSPVLQIDLGETWKHAGVPKHPYLVNLHCWLLGKSRNGTSQIAAMSFCAERPMFGLLKTKSECDGRNISDPSGINLRLGFSGPSGGTAVAQIGRDRIVPYGTRSLPNDERLNVRLNGLAAVDLMIAIGGKTTSALPCLANS